jgi:hypothetical protein
MLTGKLAEVMGVNYIRTDVEGAPFRIGDKVEVTALTDETAPENMLHKIGTVEYFEYECGCGQTYPNDPMIGVRFDENTLHEFWSEELTKI